MAISQKFGICKFEMRQKGCQCGGDGAMELEDLDEYIIH